MCCEHNSHFLVCACSLYRYIISIVYVAHNNMILCLCLPNMYMYLSSALLLLRALLAGTRPLCSSFVVCAILCAHLNVAPCVYYKLTTTPPTSNQRQPPSARTQCRINVYLCTVRQNRRTYAFLACGVFVFLRRSCSCLCGVSLSRGWRERVVLACAVKFVSHHGNHLSDLAQST